MKTNNIEFKKHVFNYILDCINTEGFEHFKYNTHKGLVNFVYETFKSEYQHGIKYYKNEQLAFSNYLAGLPSCFSVDFENYKILVLAENWGSIPANSTEKQQEKILNNWFNFIAANFFQLKNKLDHKLNLPTKYNI